MIHIARKQKDISPQLLEPNKMKATGEEVWASAFIYPNRYAY